MRRAAAAVLALSLFLSLFGPAAAAAAPREGIVVYHELCVRCHGNDGRGKAIFNTPIMQLSKLSAAEMARVIADGRGKMPAFKAQLSQAELDGVAAFLKTGLPK